MLDRQRRQRPLRTGLRGMRLVLAVYSLVGLSVLLLTIFFFSEELEAAAFGTIILVPATGLLLAVKWRRQWERRQWEQWRQKHRSRSRSEERPHANNPNDEQPRPWWQVLEISEQATFEDVKAAYRTKIKECHPDKVIGLAREFQELADRKTKEINRAFRQARIERAKSWPER
jgi:DnaJ domain